MNQPTSFDPSSAKDSSLAGAAQRLTASVLGRRLEAIIIASVLVLTLIGIAHHEFWGDEFQAWLIAAHSNSLIDLFKNTRYDGHGLLWYFLLFPIAHNSSIILMQFLHSLIALSSIVLFVYFSPFKWWQRLLFAFAFYPFYQYNIVCRDYSLIVLLTFLFCVLSQRGNMAARTLLLALLCQTGAYGIILGAAFFTVIIFDWIYDRSRQKRSAANIGEIVACALLFSLSALPAAYLLVPPQNSVFRQFHTTCDWSLLRDTISHVGKGYFLPIFTFDALAPDVLNSLLFLVSVVCLLFFTFTFASKKRALLPFVIGNLGLLSVGYAIYPGTWWHWGMYFILLIACLWLAGNTYQLPAGGSPLFSRPFSAVNLVVTAILLCQSVQGVYAWQQDVRSPYSMSGQLARFISKNYPPDVFIASGSPFGLPISALLNRQVYYPRGNRFGTFMVFDNIPEPSTDQMYAAVRKIKLAKGRPLLLLLGYFALPHPPRDCRQKDFPKDFTLVKSFYGSVMGKCFCEEYVLLQRNY